jgi:drug/metabolite transporter (DMT)-like permease
MRTPGSLGLVVALSSAAAFATSGSFATSLIDAGWSPGAAVAWRIVVAALVLTGPAVWQLRGRWRLLRASAPVTIAYGLIAVAACQLCFFYAVQRLSVGVALLLEYLGIVWIVAWQWAVDKQRPRRRTVAGSVLALAGLLFVLDVFGDAHISVSGVLWGVAAGLGLATFFLVSARGAGTLPPLPMAWAGMAVGGATLVLAGAVGVVPMHQRFTQVSFADHRVSWLVPVLGLSVLAAAFAYVAGIAATRLLGAKLASFVGLAEVLFAIGWAWLFLAQLPGRAQLLGGVLVVAGVALVRSDEVSADAPGEPLRGVDDEYRDARAA